VSLRVPKRLREPTPSHARSKVQERGLAKRTGGLVTPGSGNQRVKGDVRVKGFARIEAKTTKNKSFSVTTEMIEKLENAVTGAGEVPILHVELELGAKKCVVMPDWALDLIMDLLTDAAS